MEEQEVDNIRVRSDVAVVKFLMELPEVWIINSILFVCYRSMFFAEPMDVADPAEAANIWDCTSWEICTPDWRRQL